MARQAHRKKRTPWKFRSFAKLKTKAWILIGIIAVAIGTLTLIGPKVAELDRYLDQQMERLRARR